ncbi:MAG: enoyl-CoA hydratase [Acidobacteria bacterium]|nr:enoyl-CoA hydratase [Acidobacteriota bacterium]
MLHVLIEPAGPVVRVTLNRPDVRNAFDEALVAELTAWARSVQVGTGARVAVLAGAGRSFCAGADLAWMSKMVRYSHDENVRDARAMAAMFEALDALPIPLIGRVHGAALGGGAGLAAVCDIVVAAEDTAFGFTEVKLGIIPAVISPYVIAKIGASAARELFLTGVRFSAARAREVGLVHVVADEAELDRIIARYATEVQTAGPHAVAAAKTLVARVARQDRAAAIESTIDAIAERRVSPEGQEGMHAFLEKRKPSWTP